MKIKKILLISTLLVLFTTACKKEGGFDKRSRYITESLEGKTFTVYRIIHINPVYNVDLNHPLYDNSKIIMSFIGGNTSLDFIPGDTSLRIIHGEDYPLYRPCKFGDYQHFYMGYEADHNLILKTSTLNPPEMILTKIVKTGQNFKTLPMIAIHGEYEVLKDYHDGKPGLTLNRYDIYSQRGNGKGALITSIELIEER